jgi:DNA polymerase IV
VPIDRVLTDSTLTFLNLSPRTLHCAAAFCLPPILLIILNPLNPGQKFRSAIIDTPNPIQYPNKITVTDDSHTESPMPLGYLVIDMNSYFASAEQQLRPELRGKPIAVVAVQAESTSAIAASKEAKAFGIKTGTRVSDARILCPHIQFIQARPEEYIRIHEKIVHAIESCIHVSAVMSIDEMRCNLTGRDRLEPEARKIALQIKAAIKASVGPFLTSSVGIAPNPMLAKVASDMQKPDGLIVINTQDLPHRLHALQIRDIPGIGAKMENRLRMKGLGTMEALCAASQDQLIAAWQSPVMGKLYFQQLRGDDVAPLPTQKSSVGHSHVLPPDLRNWEDAHRVLTCMLHKAASRLRKMDYFADVLTLDISYIDGRHFSPRVHLEGSRDTLSMIRALKPLWDSRWPGTPLKVGVVLSGLETAASATAPLFQKSENLGKLAQAMDKINDKFGKHKLFFAGMHDAEKHDVVRIAFSRIPELENQSPSPE